MLYCPLIIAIIMHWPQKYNFKSGGNDTGFRLKEWKRGKLGVVSLAGNQAKNYIWYCKDTRDIIVVSMD